MTLLTVILDVIKDGSQKIAETIFDVIQRILEVITERIPEIARAASDMMIAFMTAISTEIPRIVDEAYKCAIAFINGLADAISNNNADLINAVNHLMESVIQAIIQWLVEFTPLGFLIPKEMKEGIMDGETNVFDEIGKFLTDIVGKILEKVDDFKEAAKQLIKGLIAGIKGDSSSAVKEAEQLGSDIIDGLNSKKGLDEHSKSKKGVKSGGYIDEGVVGGMQDGEAEVYDAAALLGENTMLNLDSSLKENMDIPIDTSFDIGKAIPESLESGIESSEGGFLDKVSGLWNSLKDASNATDDLNDSSKDLGDTVDYLYPSIAQYVEEQKRLAQEAQAAAESVYKLAFISPSVQQAINDQILATAGSLKITKKHTSAKKANTKAITANTAAKLEGTAATKGSSKELKTEADYIEASTGVLNSFVNLYGKLYSHLGNDAPWKVAEKAVRRFAEANAGLVVGTKQTKEAISSMVEEFQNTWKDAFNNVQSMFKGESFFQTFELKTDKTINDVLSGMQSNVNAVSSWSNKLSELASRGINQGLLKQLSELGPKGYEYVNAFFNASADELKRANALFEQSGVLTSRAADTVVAGYAQAGLNAVLGFAGGITDNSVEASNAARTMGYSSLAELEKALEEHSPSRATFRDGENLVLGLRNGIEKTMILAITAAERMCQVIVYKVSSILDTNKFVEYGKNIGIGFANGISSEESVNAVKAAANLISSLASNVTTTFNGIHSPSDLYNNYGINIGLGFAKGIESGSSYVEKSASALSESIKNTLSIVNSIVEEDTTLHPVIEPVLDLSNMKKSVNSIGKIMPIQSIGMVSSIGIGSDSNQSTNSSVGAQNGPSQINFTQNNYSPKALSRIDIYRESKNMLSSFKGALT